MADIIIIMTHAEGKNSATDWLSANVTDWSRVVMIHGDIPALSVTVMFDTSTMVLKYSNEKTLRMAFTLMIENWEKARRT